MRETLQAEAASLLDQWSAEPTRDTDWQLDVYARMPVELVRGEGAQVWDREGKVYWDFYGGHAVSLLGHCHPLWAAILAEQARRFDFYSNVSASPLRAAACRALVELAPANLTRVFLSNSGAEANEVALKLARHHTGRPNIIALEGGFHGRTVGALAVTWEPKYRAYAPPDYGHTRFIPWGDVPEIGDDVAAVILEPIQSLAGMRTASATWLQALRAACDKASALLILDEVQTAWGRLGTPFAADYFSVRADIITGAKSTGGGFPVGVTLVDQHLANKVKHGDQGSTFGGGPLACAAVLATQHVVRAENLMERARAIEAEIRAVSPVPVRGAGALLGLELGRPSGPVLAALRAHGILAGGSDDPTVIRLMPPLVTPPSATAALGDALRSVL